MDRGEVTAMDLAIIAFAVTFAVVIVAWVYIGMPT